MSEEIFHIFLKHFALVERMYSSLQLLAVKSYSRLGIPNDICWLVKLHRHDFSMKMLQIIGTMQGLGSVAPVHNPMYLPLRKARIQDAGFHLCRADRR